MTTVTIDLDDSEIAAVRSSWAHKPPSSAFKLGVVARKVYDALPPKRIEPKAGGRCKPKADSPHTKGTWEILFVDEMSVVPRLIWEGEVVACISYSPQDFAHYFEVTA